MAIFCCRRRNCRLVAKRTDGP
uniref:Uncharacterized protein n=1 Tax=Arundo donax TaxID=35708 RepID=A0A0A9HB12_ARUDO